MKCETLTIHNDEKGREMLEREITSHGKRRSKIKGCFHSHDSEHTVKKFPLNANFPSATSKEVFSQQEDIWFLSVFRIKPFLHKGHVIFSFCFNTLFLLGALSVSQHCNNTNGYKNMSRFPTIEVVIPLI